jgi:hypothetical protein
MNIRIKVKKRIIKIERNILNVSSIITSSIKGWQHALNYTIKKERSKSHC